MPARYASLFEGADELLFSHRGVDHGAARVAAALSRVRRAPLVVCRTTRLLVDVNRSPRHRELFSELTRDLGAEEKAQLMRVHYRPYRARVERAVEHAIAAGCLAVHLSSHSFTPVLAGAPRVADVGLLYDPSRERERSFAAAWRSALLAGQPGMVVRRNYPYRGVADGLVTHLRRCFPAAVYVGLELEINQNLVGRPDWPARVNAIAASLARVLAAGETGEAGKAGKTG